MQPILNARRLLSFGLITALLAFHAPGAFAASPAPPTKVCAVEGITEYRLDNGVRLLLFPDASSAKVTVNMTVLVGSRHEGYGETGMAHLLEHMLFKGTPTFPHIWKALHDHGADANGTTWPDYTHYYETMPANEANLDFAIRLEADRLVNSHVKREDLASEMTVVRNEFEKNENNPLVILRQRMLAAAYEWHNYGKTTMGNRSDIERVPIHRLQAFYRKHYQPDNVVLVIAGKFDEGKALERVAKYFGTLKRPARQLDETYTEEPAQDGERTVVLRRVGSVSAVGVMYHVPAVRHADFPALAVLLHVLAAEPHGRLYESLVRSKKADDVAGSVSEWHDPGVLTFCAQVDGKKSVEEVRETLLRVLEQLPSAPVTDKEVQRVKRELASGFETAFTDSSAMAVALSEPIAQGDWRLVFLVRDRIARVTPADVMRVAGRYLRQNNRTVGVYVPTRQAERVAVPAAPPAAELVKGYGGTKAITSGEAFEPTPENLEKRIERSVLPAGVKIALLPKKTRGQIVTAQLKLHYGNERSLKDYPLAPALLGKFMLRGTRSHDRQQIVDEANKLQAGIYATGGLGELTITLQCKRESFPGVLKLVGEILREPAFAEHELELVKREAKQALKEGQTDPGTLAGIALARRLSPVPKSDVRYEADLEETLARVDALTVDQFRRLYTEQVSGQVGEFAAVGDFDPSGTPKLLAGILKDWKTTVPYKRIARPARTDVRGGRQDIRVPDKANAVFVASELLAMRSDHPDYQALKMANFIFGGDNSSRLFNRVRQKEGLSYTVSSTFVASAQDASAKFMLYAICNPQNIDRLDRVIAEELEKLVKQGVRDDELAAAKKAVVQLWTLARSDDASLMSMLVDDLQIGRTFGYDADVERKIAKLTAAEVNQAIRRHLAPDRLVIVRGGDLKAAATKASERKRPVALGQSSK